MKSSRTTGTAPAPKLLAKNLAELKQLKRRLLAGLGAAGIKHLAGLTNVESLDLRRTKASAACVAELQKALPHDYSPARRVIGD